MSVAGRLAQRPVWLVRLPQEGGRRVAGAGMLVDQRHVVTCAHVVGQQVGQSPEVAGTGQAPAGEVVVEFPFADRVLTGRARVVGWVPIAPDLSGDAAVLRLTEPVTLTPAPLACPPSLQGHRFWVHGFPEGAAAARQARGRLGGFSGPAGEWIQVESDGASGWPVEHGFSGAPVFDHDADAVVGIVALRDEHRSGHLLPVSYLRAVWPWLDDRIGWRLDLDPSLHTHWLPRARGSEVESDSGTWYFTGRQAARQAVCDWLTDPTHTALVVTGGPGTGKSALLAHLLIAADPVLAATVPTAGPHPPEGVFDLAVQVTGLTRDEVVDRLATATGIEAATRQELLVALRERHQGGGRALTVLVDAVEEAASVDEARHIAALLRDLAATAAVRVLVGVRTAPAGTERARILATFGHTTPRIDLESRAYLRNFDIADYVEHRLTGEDTRYRNRSPSELRAIGRAVARKARYNFLIAQLATRWLAHPSTPLLNLDDPVWEHGLPETIGAAMDNYLDTCGPDTALVRRLLTALAFARGDGLPRTATWLAIADALHPAHTHTHTEVETVFHSAANYLIERTNDHHDQPTYRLYHDALDEHLREHCPTPHPQHAIVTALTDALPRRDQHRDWAATDPYTRRHLPGHAVAAQRLDDLLTDPGFLLHTHPGPLLTALPHASTQDGQLTAAVYRLSSHTHRHTDPGTRCRILALDAARLGAHHLQQHLNTTQNHLITPATAVDWRVRFATANYSPTATIATLTDHTDQVHAVAVGELDGRPIAITGSDDKTVRIWDLTEQCPLGEPLTGHTKWVRAVAVGELHGRPIAVTGSDDKTVRIWDLTEQRQLGQPLTGHTSGVDAVAVGELHGRPIAVTGSRDKTVRIWDLDKQHPIGQPLTRHTSWVEAVAVGELKGRPIAVTGSCDGAWVWDLDKQHPIGQPLTGHTGGVGAVAVGELDGHPIAVTGSHDKTVRMWDLTKQHPIGQPLTGHTSWVNAVAVGELNGHPIAVTGSHDKTVRMWDLTKQHPIGQPLTGHTGDLEAVAVGELDGHPIAVTASADKTVRMWDLTKQHPIGQPLTGHTSQICAVAVGELNGRPIAVTASADLTVRVWDLDKQHPIREPLTGHTRWVSAVAVGELNGRPIAVTGSEDKTVRVWHLDKQHPIRWPLPGHTGDVRAVAVGELNGRPIAVTGSHDKTVRVWDLTKRRPIGQPLTGHTGWVNAVAVGELNGHPIAVTGSDDKTMRVWDLTNGSCLDELIMPDSVGCLALGRWGTLVVGFGRDIAVFDTNSPLINIGPPRSRTTRTARAAGQHTSAETLRQHPATPHYRQSWWKRLFNR